MLLHLVKSAINNMISGIPSTSQVSTHYVPDTMWFCFFNLGQYSVKLMEISWLTINCEKNLNYKMLGKISGEL